MNIIYIKKRIQKILKALFYFSGSNTNSQSGDGFNSFYTIPTQLGSDTNWLKISGKESAYQSVNSTLALKSDGTLWAWGQNSNGQLGLGDTTQRTSPVQVGTDNDWIDIDCGNQISLALKSDGTLWAWGVLLGLNIPTQYGIDDDWKYISTAEGCGWAIKENGTAYGIGNNSNTQLGDGWISFATTHTLINPTEDYKYVAILKNNFSISSGRTYIIKNDGTLWQSGLISSFTDFLYNFTKIGTDNDWSMISLGGDIPEDTSFGIKEDGTLWGWGWNASGQLGLGDTNNRTIPTQVGTDNDWKYVVVGFLYVFAIKEDGTLWAWGNNSNGQLGLGDTNNRNIPTQVGTYGTNDGWEYVDTNFGCSMGIKSDGTLWAWGNNSSGQLGLGDTNNRTIPTQVGTDINWKSVSSGASHTLAIKTNGTLWGWGNNGSGRVGDGTTTQRTSPVQVGSATDWVSISAGYEASMATKNNGTLWGWGSDGWGALNIGGGFTNTSPRQVGNATNWSSIILHYGNSIAIVENTNGKELYGCGWNLYGQLGFSGKGNYTEFENIFSGSWNKIASSQSFTIGLKSDGTLWAWGNNSTGQLGLGDTRQRTSPVQIGTVNTWSSFSTGNTYTIGLRSNGTLWSWGSNANGSTGRGATSGNTTSPTQIGSVTTWNDISCGPSHSIGKRTNGTIWAWGNNSNGQLGLGDTTLRSSPVQIGSDTNWNHISSLNSRTFAIKTNGTFWVWGNNDSGFLGLNIGSANYNQFINTITDIKNWKEISSYSNHVIGIRSDGTLWAWGLNSNAQLGLGDTTLRSSPVQIGSDINWKSVATASVHSIAVKENGTLWGWGSNANGRTGRGTTSGNTTSPTQIGTDSNWSFVFSGENHSIALKSNGTLWAWGLNSNGQLGRGDTTQRTSPVQVGSDTNWKSVSCGGSHTLAIKTNGTLWAWGNNVNRQLGDGTTTQRTSPVQIGSDTNWKSVFAGGVHSLGIKTNGTAWAWGWNSTGQLGLGDTTLRSSPVQIGSDMDWSLLSAGQTHSFGIKNDKSLLGWGANFNSQLGNQSTSQSNSPILIGNEKKWIFVRASNNITLLLSTE